MKQLNENFWNFRGSYKLGGLVELGTQMSLVRRANGNFVMIDSYSLDAPDRESLWALTDNGRLIEAIINLHPFHTLHCAAACALAPHARLFGTRRHAQHAPQLPWQPGRIEEAETQALFPELEFAIPAGLDLVTADDRVHASSVLVRHRASGIVHVDDTLMVLAAPGFLRHVLPQSRLRFHPMLGKALQNRAGASEDFTGWVYDLARQWQDTRIVCAAHCAVRHLSQDGWRGELLDALARVTKTLDTHRLRHG